MIELAEKHPSLEKILTKKRGKEYDVAVMYTGGKDSSYLLYLLKNIYKLKVIAVMVDNGYESDIIWAPMKKFADSLEVPVKIIAPGKEAFGSLFKMLITEKEYFEKEGVNHICFTCNNLIWKSIVNFASENEIPYVASGLSLAQLNSGRKIPLKVNDIANSIAEKSTNVIFSNSKEKIAKTKTYSENNEFKEFFDSMSSVKKNTTTIYPYIYHSISVEDVKDILVGQFGWIPPNKAKVKDYKSSGCQIMKHVIKELEKMGIITLNEREQARWMVSEGLMDKSELDYANYDPSTQKVELSNPLFSELGVKEYLVDLCNEMGKEFKDSI